MKSFHNTTSLCVCVCAGFHTGFSVWGGISIYEKEEGGGGGDEKEGSGRQIPMSINMPQLIFQRAESAPPLPSQMSQAALSGGQSLGEGGLLLGGGGGGSQVSHPPV